MVKTYVAFGILGFFLLLFTGCATPMQPAVVHADSIQNPTIGWSGYQFKIPPGLEQIDLSTCSSGAGAETEQMMIYRLQNAWSNREKSGQAGGERFGEIFFFKDPDRKTYFFLSAHVLFFTAPVPPFSHLLSPEKRQVYNTIIRGWRHNEEHVQPTTVAGHQALHIFEPRLGEDNSPPMAVAFCVFLGDTKDVYIIAGYSESKDAPLLKQNMQKMMDGFSFL